MSINVLWTEKHVGKHVLTREGDLVTITFAEHLHTGELRAITQAHDEVLLGLGRLYVLCDHRQVRSASRMTNSELKERPTTLPAHCVAYVGTPFPLRIVMEMAIRATRLLTRAKLTHKFFDTIDEARAWLIELGAKPSGAKCAP